jgi:RNA polymerase sigma-70 factor (ECF subfamily)
MAAAGEGTRRAVEQAARDGYGKLVAILAARTGDVAGAEDALSEAFAAALAAWPGQGVPRAPEAWLLAVARRKSIDRARRRSTQADGGEALAMLAAEITARSETDMVIPDERLRLMFVCAHPAIEEAARAPLILQAVLGLDAAAIASAFLVSPATMGQRLVRAKRKIRAAGIPFRLPERDELPERLDVVLDAIYAAFAAGWSDPAGAVARTRDFAEEAIWLGRLVVSLQPNAAETLGLLALMLHAEARRAARRDDDGEFVPLDEQDVSRWDAALIDEAETILLRASVMGTIGRFQLEAAVQSAHAVRRRTGRADWPAILELYDGLLRFTGSPVVAINRAVAIGELHGPRAALVALDAVAGDERLAEYQPYWAACAGMLALAGEREAADAAYLRAIGLEADPAVRRFLQRKRQSLTQSDGGSLPG